MTSVSPAASAVDAIVRAPPHVLFLVNTPSGFRMIGSASSTAKLHPVILVLVFEKIVIKV